MDKCLSQNRREARELQERTILALTRR
jgi:hypothetical protein